MKIIVKIISFLFLILSFNSCIKEGMEVCQGNVRINIYAEQFQNPSQDPLYLTEEVFSDRINYLNYYLYKEGKLYTEGVVSNFKKNTYSSHPLTFDNLDYGEYNLVLVANSTKDALKGDCINAENLCLNFSSCADTEDYFTAVFPFTVDSQELLQFNAGMHRAHGVVRFKFKNMPKDVTSMEIMIENVSSEKWILGDYKTAYNASHKFILLDTKKDTKDDTYYLMGTFPTFADEYAKCKLKFYRDSKANPILDQILSEELVITRNQLVDIITDYGDGNVNIQIILDADWDGTTTGGEIEL